MISKVSIRITNRLWGVSPEPVSDEQAVEYAAILERRIQDKYPYADVSVRVGERESLYVSGRGGADPASISDIAEEAYAEWSALHTGVAQTKAEMIEVSFSKSVTAYRRKYWLGCR